jgi:hypothetical protein
VLAGIDDERQSAKRGAAVNHAELEPAAGAAALELAQTSASFGFASSSSAILNCDADEVPSDSAAAPLAAAFPAGAGSSKPVAISFSSLCARRPTPLSISESDEFVFSTAPAAAKRDDSSVAAMMAMPIVPLKDLYVGQSNIRLRVRSVHTTKRFFSTYAHHDHVALQGV